MMMSANDPKFKVMDLKIRGVALDIGLAVEKHKPDDFGIVLAAMGIYMEVFLRNISKDKAARMTLAKNFCKTLLDSVART